MKRLLLIAAALLSGLAQSATITDVRVSGAGPITFGQVFAAGDMKKSDVLVGSIAGTAVPLQVDIKATHADGSVRHAIISAQAPKAGTMLLNTGGIPDTGAALIGSIPSVAVSATIGGVKYSASPSGAFKASWLQGPIVSEWQSVVPLTTADGSAHPHLTARFAIRYYTASKKSRVDITIENDWAYEPGPQNFTYDADISIGGKSVYSKAALTHYHHARWRKVFWYGGDPGINVQANTAYLITSKAVPNYDQSIIPSAAVLAQYGALPPSEPMGIGAATAYMPTTGAHNDIGLLPAWAAAYVLSMDSRARDATMATGDGAGSFPMHYRDRVTDHPVSLTNYPRMTILGKQTDTFNDATGKYESFPPAGGDVTSPYTVDTAHQPSLAFLPYLISGDYYYLEEMQFWAAFNLFKSNPNYRGYEKGWMVDGELRDQAWGLRTLAQTAAFTPDADAMKADLVVFMNNNLDWYNTNYPNNTSFGPMQYMTGVNNKLGVMTHIFSIAYYNGTAVSTWMDDFFTSAVGYANDLGFIKAKPLLDWKAKFPVARMTEVCWMMGAPYSLTIRDSGADVAYDTVAKAYAHDMGAAFMALPCAGADFTAGWVAKVGGNGKPGDMGNISEGNMGYPSNMQPALAYAADSGIAGAAKAWQLFMGRTVKPDYSLGAQFAIVPRGVVVPPVVNPPAPPKAGKVTTGSNVKLVKQGALTVVFIDPSTFATVKTFVGVVATSKGAFTVSDILLIPGSTYLVIISGAKPLDAFLLTIPK